MIRSLAVLLALTSAAVAEPEGSPMSELASKEATEAIQAAGYWCPKAVRMSGAERGPLGMTSLVRCNNSVTYWVTVNLTGKGPSLFVKPTD